METVLGETTGAYILDNGTVLMATGLFPTPPYVLDVELNFASWQEEADPVATGTYSVSLSSDSIETGDPFVDFGGVPVFDLVSDTPMNDN